MSVLSVRVIEDTAGKTKEHASASLTHSPGLKGCLWVLSHILAWYKRQGRKSGSGKPNSCGKECKDLQKGNQEKIMKAGKALPCQVEAFSVLPKGQLKTPLPNRLINTSPDSPLFPGALLCRKGFKKKKRQKTLE